MFCSSLSSKCDLKAVLLSFPHLNPALLTDQVCVGLRGAREHPKLGGSWGWDRRQRGRSCLRKVRSGGDGGKLHPALDQKR